MREQTWFVTGASSGLGAAIARAALHAGYRVAATARDRARLETLVTGFPGRVLPLSMDLTQPLQIAAAVLEAEDWSGGSIDVLINNAGVGYIAAIEEGEEFHIRTLFETNVFGLTATIRAALPGMRKRGSGTIINVSSVSGVVGMPAIGYYCASKFAVEAISEALAEEVAAFGIQVMAIEPGGIRTGIFERNLRSPKIGAYAETAHSRIEMLESDKEGVYAPSDPNRIAEILLELVALGTMPKRLILGPDSWGLIMTKLEEQRAGYETWKDTSLSSTFT